MIPEVREISDHKLHENVITTWASAIAQSDFENLAEVPWWPPHEAKVGSLSLVEHVRAVVKCAIAIVDSFGQQTQTEGDIHRDDVIAGAVLHDISKVFEIVDGNLIETHELLPHPHLSVYVLARNDFSVHIQHIVLAHSDRSGVDPQTIEAKIVAIADELVVDEIYWRTTGHLKTNASKESNTR
ncbi:HD domain-containing protein [Halalkalicoccus salilacus]